MHNHLRKSISILVVVAFILTSIKISAFAQNLPDDPSRLLPSFGIRIHLSPEFTPAHLKGLIVHPENPLRFDFIVARGDELLNDQQKHDTYQKLIKYFLASLAVPDENQWVNLSPYEKDRIIKDDFGKTEMGRDLLAQDYVLKQLTASLIYPEENLGRKFWDKVYAQADKQYGTINIPVNTFNKVWIIPDSASVYEHGNMVYVLSQHLKVMLQEDYLSLQKHTAINSSAAPEHNINAIGSQVVREIVLPALEKEINEGKNFAVLRQVYSAMILAAWYKYNLKTSLLGKIYANKDKVKGIDQNPQNNQEIYQEYLKAFKKGVFNFIKEDVDKYTHQSIPRKYFSGGTKEGNFFGENPVDGTPVARIADKSQASADEENVKSDVVTIDFDATIAESSNSRIFENGMNFLSGFRSPDKISIKDIVSSILLKKDGKSGKQHGSDLQDFIKRFRMYVKDPLINPLTDKPVIFPKLLEAVLFNEDAHFRENIKQREEIMDMIKAVAAWASTSDSAMLEVHLFDEGLPVVESVGDSTLGFEKIASDMTTFEMNKYSNHVWKGSAYFKVGFRNGNYVFLMGVLYPEFFERSFEISQNPSQAIVIFQKAKEWAETNMNYEDIFQQLKSYNAELFKMGDTDQNKTYSDQTIKRGITFFVGYYDAVQCYVLHVFGSNHEDPIFSIPISKNPYHAWQAFHLGTSMAQRGQDVHMILMHVEELREILGDAGWEKDLMAEWAELQRSKQPADKASLSKPNPYGGIDFNAAHLKFQIKRANNGSPLSAAGQQDLENIQIDGLVPRIIAIKPAELVLLE